jgi:hypothetical protein
MGRRYIGGVGGGSSFFKQSNNPGDYTTEDIVVDEGAYSFTVPKGTYIGVGAMTEDFLNIPGVIKGTTRAEVEDFAKAVIKRYPERKSRFTEEYMQSLMKEDEPVVLRDVKKNPQRLLHFLRRDYTNWYKDNESKNNFGYTDPKTFIKDTNVRAGKDVLSATDEQLNEYIEDQSYKQGNKSIITSESGEATASYDYFPEYITPIPGKNIEKIEPKRIDKIDIEQKPVELQKAIEIDTPELPPSRADLYMERLNNAKVYENRPDEFSDKAAKNVRGRKKVTTQYVFSDDNPFKPDGRYFMGGVDSKGRRKTSGNLNKAREWERKFGLGIQKDIVGYIPSLEFGG